MVVLVIFDIVLSGCVYGLGQVGVIIYFGFWYVLWSGVFGFVVDEVFWVVLIVVICVIVEIFDWIV